mmetsp:Transcript_32143/g.91186  ORF Transcript_32143/g.91186 Transcript_32143/m.91186 type:complete len:323 (-) Transcript_32143:120-1088(-)
MAGLHSGGPPTFWQKAAWYYWRRFSHSPTRDGVIYGIMLLFMFIYGVIAFLGPFIRPPCDKEPPVLPFRNPDFNPDPCITTRSSRLLGLSLRECDFIRAIMFAVLLGCIIGYERRAPDRAAGIRSMSLVAMGSCCFTISSSFAFETGPAKWDASRVSADIPKAVGFIGAGIIWKGFVKSSDGGPDNHQIHGLTTASSVWLSAAIGIACGGNLLPQAFFCVAGIILMLRFGPRNSELVAEHEEDLEDQDLDSYPFDQEDHPAVSPNRQSPTQPLLSTHPEELEHQRSSGPSHSALRLRSLSPPSQSFKLSRAPSKRAKLSSHT